MTTTLNFDNPVSRINADQLKKTFSGLEKAQFWIHAHPTSVKAIEIISLIAGIGLVATLPFTATVIGVGGIAAAAITGAVLILAASTALFALDFFAPPHHDMKSHAFKPGQCEGGKLYYEGDVPILTLESDDPFKAGKAHGYLLGDSINKITKRFDLVLHTFLKRPRAQEISQTLSTIRQTIPLEYLLEMEGLVQGYNQWSSEHKLSFPKKLSVDDLLLLHLMPDSLHFSPSRLQGQQRPESQRIPMLACTSLVDREAGGFKLARNMDWVSLGLVGTNSLMIHRKHSNHLRNTIEVGTPGMVGIATGMNDQGLSISMNVCQGATTEIRGMPAVLYNRHCLEQCRSIAELEGFVQTHSPLGPYHLTAVDRNQGQSFHFYQSPQNSHVIRRWEQNRPLATLNCRYSPELSCGMHYHKERKEELTRFFHQRGNRPLEEALSLPYVNNWESTHSIVMQPQTHTFKVAFDNAYSGKSKLLSVPIHKLFTA